MNALAAKLFPGDSAKDSAAEFAGFVSDDLTRGIVAALVNKHWPDAPLQSGGASAAAAYLAGADAAKRLLVDLSDSTNPRADLADLKQLCGNGTSIVALGNENNVEMYRDLLRHGAADYLVKPVNPEALEEALLAAAQEPAVEISEAPNGNVGVVIGARGGVGATTITLNCAWIMSQEIEKNVALIDLDLQFGTAALDLDVAPGRGLSEALQNPSRIDGLFISSAMTKSGERLAILASEEVIDKSVIPEAGALNQLVSELRDDFDWVWIDMPRTTVWDNHLALTAASHILIVSDLSLAGMRDTLRIANFCRECAPDTKLLYAINRPGEQKQGLPAREFERGIGGEIDYTFPNDDATAAAAAAAGKPLSEVGKKGKLTNALRKLCGDLAGTEEATKKASLARRLLLGGEK